jgi:tRNA A37 N6-isopentenylltransferase MiaA
MVKQKFEECREKIKQETRRFAKGQLTWLEKIKI